MMSIPASMKAVVKQIAYGEREIKGKKVKEKNLKKEKKWREDKKAYEKPEKEGYKNQVVLTAGDEYWALLAVQRVFLQTHVTGESHRQPRETHKHVEVKVV